jgi:MFS family permease
MSTPSSNSGSGLALYIGVVQFFFATTWTIYVIYLPQLAAQAGIAKQWVPWILVADQVVFAIMDVLTGFWVDRMRAAMARFGAWVLGLTVLSSIAFIALPFAGANAVMLLIAILVWAVTSSALRSPPWAMLARHAATPSIPWLSTLVLLGSAVAAAMAPYLGLALKGVDPKLPFVISTITLVLTVAGLVHAERRFPSIGAPADASRLEMGVKPLALLYAAILLMAIGFQACFSLNAAPQYLKFMPGPELPYFMPVFWIGFNVMMFAGAALVRRLGVLECFALAAAAGAIAAVAAASAPGIEVLAAAQFFAGGAWGAASVAAYTAAIAFGRTGREGRFLGLLFAMLALAAFARIGAVASGAVLQPSLRELLPWLPQTAWLAAGLLLLAARAAMPAPRPAAR